MMAVITGMKSDSTDLESDWSEMSELPNLLILY